ncbi:uncharacterized protein [Dendropsophus ebraccatus]|uniref:uncharacterized protein n=1 Tax=Dendropsophus ebraccatus TaxID=150705 RepID=UPI0038313390
MSTHYCLVTTMASKRKRSSEKTEKRLKRISPFLSEEEKKKRAQKRAILHKELNEMSRPFQDPNYILSLQPLRMGEEPRPSTSKNPVDSWCHCGNCILLPTTEECICCRDVHMATMKLEEDDTISCITDHNMFVETCLNKAQLTICEMYRCFGNTHTAPMENRNFRKAAYRMFTMWVHGYLGPKKRRPIPACAVNKVRQAFPEENQEYVGFRQAYDFCAADMADDLP